MVACQKMVTDYEIRLFFYSLKQMGKVDRQFRLYFLGLN